MANPLRDIEAAAADGKGCPWQVVVALPSAETFTSVVSVNHPVFWRTDPFRRN